MNDDSQNLKPLQITLRSKYLGIDLARVRRSLENFISQGDFFSKPLDNAHYEVVTNEGTRREMNLTPLLRP